MQIVVVRETSMLEYSNLKDDLPENTIEKIKNILNDLDIQTEEILIDKKQCSILNSLSVQLERCDAFSTNGKGTSLLNAKASAYAEFIERLQNNILINFQLNNHYFSIDEEMKDVEALFESSLKDTINDKKVLYWSNKLANKLVIDLNNEDKTIFVPFYSLREKKVMKLPILIFRLFQTSNGMAAGNTIEEALVQGLSEICERFTMKKIIEKNVSIPDIPEEEYIEYKNIKKC